MKLLELIPRSAYIAVRGGALRVADGVRFDYADFASWCAEAFFARTGLPDGGAARIALRREAMPEEAYRLTVTETGAEIAAASERGVIWALTTLYKLIDGGKIDCCDISDAPKYAHRALSLDCARHFFPAAEVMRIIEGAALEKLNVLHWHLSDDQGWRVESERFPRLNECGGEYYTKDEIRAVVEYARVRGVEIVPEIDLPGHTSAILAAYPELSCTGEPVALKTAGGVYSVILCAGKDSVCDFIEALLDELSPLFPSARFHIGGDEAPKTRWRACPDCQARIEALGLGGAEQLQGYFSCRAADMLRARGKCVICWNEALRAHRVPDGAQVQYWTLQHRHQMQQYAEAGGEWIYSDMFELYFDYPHSMIPLKRVYTVRPHFGKKSFEGTGLIGLEGCLWAEHIEDCGRLESRAFPRAAALAELAWSGEGDYDGFRRRLRADVEYLERAGIAPTPEDWWDPKGRARLEEAVGYLTHMNASIPAEGRPEVEPSRELVQSFVQKFFRLTDIPALISSMRKSGRG